MADAADGAPVVPPVRTVTFLGCGYVGGPTMAVIAQKCPEITVYGVDLIQSQIDRWNSDNIPIYEPGLFEIVKEVRGKNLHFTSDPRGPIREADIIFVCVGTPTKVAGVGTPAFAALFSSCRGMMGIFERWDLLSFGQFCVLTRLSRGNWYDSALALGRELHRPLRTVRVLSRHHHPATGAGAAANLMYIESAARSIANYATSPKIVVEKSTVPVHTSRTISTILAANATEGTTFNILSNPEFLAEGTAVQDLHHPDRILVGGENEAAVETLVSVYNHWIPRDRIITTGLWSSELSKLVANAFLAQRISSINAVSAFCEASGANVAEVSNAIGRDSRIGPRFLQASVGFGGSCFQKDILNLVYLCGHFNLPEVADYWRSVITMNDYQKARFSRRIAHDMFDTVNDKAVAVLGFAFKKDTGDTRETPALYVCRDLLAEKARLRIYDPQVSRTQMVKDLTSLIDTQTVHEYVEYCSSAYDAAMGAHAIVVLTEWDEFKTLDYQKMYDSMAKPAFVFDGRYGCMCALDRAFLAALRKIGFQVYVVGQT